MFESGGDGQPDEADLQAAREQTFTLDRRRHVVGVGRDDDEVRTGNAMILDPYGRIVAETLVPAESVVLAESVVVADLDLDLVPLATGRRWLRGRRPELYGVLTERTGDELDPRAARFSTDPVSR